MAWSYRRQTVELPVPGVAGNSEIEQLADAILISAILAATAKCDGQVQGEALAVKVGAQGRICFPEKTSGT